MAVHVEGCCSDLADDDFEDFQCENDLCGDWHSEVDRYDEDDIESKKKNYVNYLKYRKMN